MSKGVIVVDMPQKCGECPVCASWRASALSVREYWCPKMECRGVDPDTKPSWCPIKPIPEKDKSESFLDEFQEGMKTGWNLCIDKVLREGDLNEID